MKLSKLAVSKVVHVQLTLGPSAKDWVGFRLDDQHFAPVLFSRSETFVALLRDKGWPVDSPAIVNYRVVYPAMDLSFDLSAGL